MLNLNKKYLKINDGSSLLSFFTVFLEKNSKVKKN